MWGMEATKTDSNEVEEWYPGKRGNSTFSSQAKKIVNKPQTSFSNYKKPAVVTAGWGSQATRQEVWTKTDQDIVDGKFKGITTERIFEKPNISNISVTVNTKKHSNAASPGLSPQEVAADLFNSPGARNESNIQGRGRSKSTRDALANKEKTFASVGTAASLFDSDDEF